MKKQDNSKNKILILIIAGVIFLVISVILIIFLTRNNVQYPEEPITQTTLGQSSKYSIDIKGLENTQKSDYKLYAISTNTILEKIRELTDEFNLDLTDETENQYYYWSNEEGDYLQYSLTNNYLNFKLSSQIEWSERELTGNSFNTFVNKYFDKDWKYTLTKTLPFNDGATIYYANRVMPNDIKIETSELFNQTDYLQLDSGKITAGKILLTNFVDDNLYVPIITNTQLSNYINLEEYPKSIFFNQGEIAKALSIEDEYLNPEILEIQEEISECRALKSNVVYLYQTFDEDFLTPVFKIDLECTVDYENEDYYVPATAYVNAINPEYISSQ